MSGTALHLLVSHDPTHAGSTHLGDSPSTSLSLLSINRRSGATPECARGATSSYAARGNTQWGVEHGDAESPSLSVSVTKPASMNAWECRRRSGTGCDIRASLPCTNAR